MKKTISLLILSILSHSALAASFDCQKAQSKIEKAICENEIISALDEKLSSDYRRAIKNSEEKEKIKQQQSAWLNSQRGCKNDQCLLELYISRIESLQSKNNNDLSQDEDAIAGFYQRYFNNQTDKNYAEITIESTKNGMNIIGNSSWISNETTGSANISDIDGTLLKDSVFWIYKNYGCEFRFVVSNNVLIVFSDNHACGGANVTFEGIYRKANPSINKNKSDHH